MQSKPVRGGEVHRLYGRIGHICSGWTTRREFRWSRRALRWRTQTASPEVPHPQLRHRRTTASRDRPYSAHVSGRSAARRTLLDRDGLDEPIWTRRDRSPRRFDNTPVDDQAKTARIGKPHGRRTQARPAFGPLVSRWLTVDSARVGRARRRLRRRADDKTFNPSTSGRPRAELRSAGGASASLQPSSQTFTLSGLRRLSFSRPGPGNGRLLKRIAKSFRNCGQDRLVLAGNPLEG